MVSWDWESKTHLPGSLSERSPTLFFQILPTPSQQKGTLPLTTFYLQNNSSRLKILCLELKSTVLFCRLPLFVFKSFIWSNLKSVCCLSVGSAPSMLAVICPLLPPFSLLNITYLVASPTSTSTPFTVLVVSNVHGPIFPRYCNLPPKRNKKTSVFNMH